MRIKNKQEKEDIFKANQGWSQNYTSKIKHF